MAATTPPASFFSWQSKDSWEPTEFYWTDDGNIVCQACPSTPNWCMHIELLTIENGDANPIWEMGELLWSIQIPLFPTANLWTRASLKYVTKVDAYAVGISTDEATENIQMGYLHRGEGRNVIRQMILDWFDGQFGRSTTLTCMSSSHKPFQELQWQEAMKDDNRRIKNLWSVWDTHSCIACSVSPDAFDDLVPDGSSTRRPVF